MGDRWDLQLPCCTCAEMNDVWYAPTCESTDFDCIKCGTTNDIVTVFTTRKGECRREHQTRPAEENPKQVASIIREYVRARLDGADDFADRIWAVNPDLQNLMVVAMMREKKC